MLRWEDKTAHLGLSRSCRKWRLLGEIRELYERGCCAITYGGRVSKHDLAAIAQRTRRQRAGLELLGRPRADAERRPRFLELAGALTPSVRAFYLNLLLSLEPFLIAGLVQKPGR
jgi:hypothetical protein